MIARLSSSPRLALALAVLVGSPEVGHAASPSFDCSGARGRVETAICRSERVARLDVRIDAAYRRLMRAFESDAEARQELRTAQRDFLERREAALDAPYDGFVRHHEAQAALLEAIDPAPRAGFEGEWSNLSGSIRIRRGDAGFAVWGSTVEPVLNRWICDVDDIGEVAGGTFVTPVGATAAGFPEWSIRIERAGVAIRVVEVGPAGTATLPDGSAAEQTPRCGRRGRFDGIYFPSTGLMRAR